MHWDIWVVKLLLSWVHFRVLELQLPMHASPTTGMATNNATNKALDFSNKNPLTIVGCNDPSLRNFSFRTFSFLDTMS